MQSTNIKEIKAALWRQAFIGDTWVSCGMGQVVAIRRRQGQLLAMIRGWSRWHTVETVFIEGLWFSLTPTTSFTCGRATGEHF